MKKTIILLLTCLLTGIPLHSQVLTQYNIENGLIRNELNKAKKNTKTIKMPSFDLEKLMKEDREMAFEDVPFRFGHGFDVDYTLNDGVWTNYDNGRLWSLTFSSKDANSLNFVFEDFSLPEGAYLYITNQSESVVYGPVMPESIPKDGYFLTDLIPGSEATICLFEPNSKKNASKIKIKRVVHGYRGIVINDSNGNVGGSASCNIPVENHPEYQDESNAVALIMLEDGSSLCSGSLIMTTDMSFKPYLLTAFHCISYIDSLLLDYEINRVNHWAIKFGFKQSSNFSVTFNGAQFLSGWVRSDFSLVRILEDVKRFPLTWLGWDNTGNVPTNGAGIHHPHGDYMKISIYEEPAISSLWYGDPVHHHWRVGWNEGITEGGSSGSPLLDQNKRVVGQLHGIVYEFGDDEITPPCDILYSNYGQFYYSWTGAGSADKRLSNWLDSIGTGQQTMNTDHYYHISGDETLYNQSVYSITHIADLMSYFTVSWSLSGNNAPNFTVQNDTPNTNQCTVTRKEHPVNSWDNRVTLNAHIMYNGVTFATISKEITTPYIYGPDNPCLTDGYCVNSLPSNCTVSWDFSGTGYSVVTDFVPEDTIQNNGFCVQRTSSQDFANGTITANLSNGNTLTKHISSAAGLTGTWYQTSSHFPPYIPDATPSNLECGVMYIVDQNKKIVLQSDDFIDATLTCNNGNVSLMHFQNSNIASFYTNTNNGNTFTVRGYKSGTCIVYKFIFKAIGEPILYLSVNSSGHDYVFSLLEKQAEERSGENLSKSQYSGKWQLTITQYETGQTVYEGNCDSQSITVNTAGWKSGVYVVIAKANDNTITQKISISE